jgi:hypothetical protein
MGRSDRSKTRAGPSPSPGIATANLKGAGIASARRSSRLYAIFRGRSAGLDGGEPDSMKRVPASSESARSRSKGGGTCGRMPQANGVSR